MSSREALGEAVALAGRMRHVFVATADAGGLPHVAAARKLTLAGERAVAVTEWFCPGTVANLEQNSRIAVAVWDPEADVGYQLLGDVERGEVLAMLDGCAPEAGVRLPRLRPNGGSSSASAGC